MDEGAGAYYCGGADGGGEVALDFGDVDDRVGEEVSVLTDCDGVYV